MNFLDNHRGPFILHITRPFATKPGFYRSEWLMGELERSEVEDEARALLADTRDTIVGVHVWSISEQSFIGGYK